MNEDFKRPLGNVTREQQPDALPPPAVSSEQRPPVAPPKKKSNRAFSFVSMLLLLSLLGAGVLGYLWFQDSQKLEDSRARISALEANQSNIPLNKDGNQPIVSGLSPEEKVKLAASGYYCALAGFGCDKAQSTVTKIQDAEMGKAGFAIVKAVGPSTATNLFLKTVDNVRWIVVYEGQNTPPQDVIDKFAIPVSFAGPQQ